MRIHAFIAAFTISLLALPSWAQTTSTDAAAAQCKSLESTDFSHILDAPTQVTEAKLLEANGDKSSFCQVKGYVAPTVGFELRLPIANWNGKFFEVGCGGFCGSTE